MPTEELIKIEEGLERVLIDVLKNPRNSQEIQGVLTLYHKVKSKDIRTSSFPVEDEKIPIVDLFLKNKYAQFYEEFAQTASINQELRLLVDYLTSNGWDSNLS